MASERQGKWARLTRMSWAEARSRIGQEGAKRLDFALYSAGWSPRVPPLCPQPIATSRFFFGTDKGELARRAALLRQHLPQETENIIREADNICRHQFQLLGYDKLDFGPVIDWHRDPVHGKHSPLNPWFKINFLDFRAVGDHKIIWELNRHQHLVTLAKAWTLTGNPAYTKELVSQWYSWQKENPYPLGINWASALEVAFRSLSWLWIRNFLADSSDILSTFHADTLIALQLHGRYIERYLSTYFSPNTHLLGEAVALFFIGTLCPQVSAAERWRSKGWQIILEESERQVRPDGVHFEQAFYYHVYALDFFLHARLLAGENGLAIPERFDSVLKKMLDVVQALSSTGSPQGFGDDDGGRVFNPRRNRVEHMTDPLALGAVLYDCNKYSAASLTEEAIWLFGEKAVQQFGDPKLQPTPVSRAFTSGGIYLINDHLVTDHLVNDYETCAQQLMVDAGPQGEGRAGHGHADALSIRSSLDGQRFLVDPGTYCYISDDNERERFRGTAAHNTLRVDNLDQATPSGPFAWSSIPNITAERWVDGETFDFLTASHDGYLRLSDPVLHRRQILHVKGGLWFVRDLAEGHDNHLLESFWHFAPELAVTNERGTVFAASPAAESATRVGLAMLTAGDSVWTAEIAEGFVSPAYGLKQVSPVVRISANVKLPKECGVLLLPTTRMSEIGAFTALSEAPLRGASGYRYQTRENAEFFFFAPGSLRWECGPWASDAALLYCKLRDGRLAHVIMVSGSFAEWRGKPFVSRPSPVEAFEWLSRPDLKTPLGQAEQGVVREFQFVDRV